MKTDIYIFATDVDGTLLMDDGNIHPITLDAFKRAYENGHMTVIATGRAVSGAINLLKKIPYINYLVCNNGAAIYDVKKDSALSIHHVNPNHYPIVIDFAKENNIGFKLHTNKNVYGWGDGKPTPITEEFDSNIRQHIKKYPNDVNLFNGEIITQLAIFEPFSDFCKKNLNKFKELFGKDSSIFLTNSFFIDVNPKNTSKWSGLLELANLLNIDHKKIVTFGDSGNDYEMLMGAGENGYAMGNSHEDLVEKIKPKIGDNNSGAIGLKINEYLDEKK